MPRRNTILAAACGSVATLGGMFLLGAADNGREQIGRYQLVATEKHAMIVDTVNGVVWDYVLGDSPIEESKFTKAKR